MIYLSSSCSFKRPLNNNVFLYYSFFELCGDNISDLIAKRQQRKSQEIVKLKGNISSLIATCRGGSRVLQGEQKSSYF